MSDENAELPDDPAISPDATASGDEELPPVRPPSAGFVVQLFLVPGLIVLVVVGVWALFGRMASSEQDWQRLVGEIGHTNPHRRWRGAMGLAQLLQADAKRGDHGDKLATEPKVAEALCGMFEEELQSNSTRPDDVQQQAFLARALGMLDVPETVLPALRQGMRPETDPQERIEIRKNAIASVAVIAGRAQQRDPSDDPSTPGKAHRKVVEFPGLLDDVVFVSRDGDPLIRQLAAYTLGLLPSPRSRQRLEVMLGDSDEKARINAAVALARQNSTRGLPVFEAVLKQATRDDAPAADTPEERTASRYFWIGVAVVTLFVAAVWTAGTTVLSRRIVAAAVALGSLTFVCYGIYDLVQHPTGARFADDAVADGNGGDEPSFAQRQKQARSVRFERLVIVQNTLKAVTDLSPRFTDDEKARLAVPVEAIADKYGERKIRIVAHQALQTLKVE
ncbi:MAG: HEAT repeat domain-containing protein [Planctomycetaceae bacterium]